jgi:hypothetical protein
MIIVASKATTPIQLPIQNASSLSICNAAFTSSRYYQRNMAGAHMVDGRIE